MLRRDLEELAEHGTATALAPTAASTMQLGRWVDEIDKRLKTDLRPNPYQEARSALVASSNAGDAAQSFESAARWLREFARAVDGTMLS